MSQPLTRQQYIEYCNNCSNKSFDNQIGLICGLSNEQPSFVGNCVSKSPITDEMEDIQQQLVQLKSKKRRWKTVWVSLSLSIATIMLIFTVKEINAATKHKELSAGFERTAGDFFKDKDYDGAIYYYEISIEYDDQNITAIYSLGRCYEELENYEKAIKYYRDAIALNSNYAIALRSRGYSRYKIDDFDNAIEDYLRSLELEPKNTAALGNVGSIYEEKCDFEKARKYYYETLKYNPEHYGIMSSLASLEFDLGNYDVSIDLCYKVIGNLDFGKDAPHGTIALAYQATNKYDSAIVHLNKALEYAPNNEHYYNNKGYSLSILGNDIEAIKNYNRAISIDSTNPNCFLNRGDAKYNLHLYREAIEDYNQAILLSELYEGYNCGICFNNRGAAKHMIGDSIGFKRDFAIADSLGYPESYSSWTNLGAKADFYNKK
ncbi:tetratricopeptide repeat protein [Carboxylicivirga sp. N1Y90]|uniref:tetratricopeptide repeat protein n=1 Tax=Carboxylicivirga fragile TaxID=3417571 RepID=UPI003D32DB4B|nr:tetratricopeptide repeat protein [Marinilabiliaceae bacterium N1Y90]